MTYGYSYDSITWNYSPLSAYAPLYSYVQPYRFNFGTLYSFSGYTNYSPSSYSYTSYAPTGSVGSDYSPKGYTERSNKVSLRSLRLLQGADAGSVKGDAMFDEALNFVLGWEGGFSNDPADSGGRTNKGITQNTYNAWLKKNGLPEKDVKNITNEEVRQIYYNEYWEPLGCSNLPEKVALFIFDTGVNMGVGRGKEYLRRYNNGESLESLIDAREGKYRAIAANSPTKRKFLNGWLNRLGDLESTIAMA